MKIEPLAIPEVVLITPPRFTDARGFFSETWVRSKLEAQGFSQSFVQDNHSFSAEAGTIRGLHCQIAPRVQGKLVRVVRGSVWDVAVDIRHGSPNYGRHVAVTLSAQNWAQLWVPPGFLHGFCTLEPGSEVVYKVTDDYNAASERAVIWNDPDLALPWPIAPEQALLSDKDRSAPRLAQCDAWYRF